MMQANQNVMMNEMHQEIRYENSLTYFAIFAEEKGAVLLDSAELRNDSGRYSFIGIDPFQVLKSKNGKIDLGKRSFEGDPFSFLEEQLALFHVELYPDMPPFQGGVMGYFSYDLCQHLENLPSVLDERQFPDLMLGFYDLVIAFDNELKRAWIFSSGLPENTSDYSQKRCAWLVNRLREMNPLPALSQTVCAIGSIQTNFTAPAYQGAVDKVIDYIYAGDIFEANISQCFTAPLVLPTFELYRRVCAINPAPFAAYLCFEDVVLASASPERFLKLTQKKIEARPIKGTRPRGKTIELDEEFSTELLSSEKDCAENIMIVDLLRNDLSRVCADTSVVVTQLCGLESYATVHHLVSVIKGELKAEYNAVDLLRATFPGGSITGAPKIRAMEIIAEIERTARGPYCGSIGYIGFNGDMDLSIVIRTFAIKNNVVTFQVGGAVVSDSDPLVEYEETLTKAKALLSALTQRLE